MIQCPARSSIAYTGWSVYRKTLVVAKTIYVLKKKILILRVAAKWYIFLLFLSLLFSIIIYDDMHI